MQVRIGGASAPSRYSANNTSLVRLVCSSHRKLYGRRPIICHLFWFTSGPVYPPPPLIPTEVTAAGGGVTPSRSSDPQAIQANRTDPGQQP